MVTGDGTGSGESVVWRPVLVISAVVAVAHLVVATRFGWHRDEFYYVASGRHLAWGYPDQPPLTPVLARLAAAMPGGVLPLRIVAVGFQAATIVLGGLTAHELGGGRRAQSLAAGAVAGCGVFVGASLFLGTTPVDQFLWAVVVLCALRAVRTGSMRWWIPMGVAGGVGLENKHTVAVLLGAIGVGFLVRRRDVLGGAGPWIAAAIAMALWAPNLVWDARHHWVTFQMAGAIADDQGGIGGSLAQLPLLLLVLPAPPLVSLWVRGARFGSRRAPERDDSWFIVAAGVVVVATVMAGGKPYYPAPLLLPLFALGAVATERLEADRGAPLRWTTGLVAVAVVVSPIVSLPVATPEFSTLLRPAAKEPMETYGWPQLVEQVDAVLAEHPSAGAVYAGNYGEAGALERFGRRAGRSVPVVSGHNAYGQWGPPPGTPTEIIAVGQFDRAFLERSWSTVERIAPIQLPDGVENDEGEHAGLYWCRDPKGTWTALWPTLSYLS